MDNDFYHALASFSPPSGYLDGRVVLITGASRGIGAALTMEAARLGAQVVMLARSVQDMGTIADQCLAQNFVEPMIVPINLEAASTNDYADVVEAIDAKLGRMDGLVLNAGMLGELAPIQSYDPITWAKVFQLNVHSQFLLLQAALPLLGKSEDSSVIFTTSSVGRNSRAHWGAYAVSKFATEGLMQTLADEYESASMRVNAVNPGRTRTRMRRAAYPAEEAASLPEPREVILPFIFLLGSSARGCNGLSVDAQQ
ncbi:MAG: YciK family oxidoreductase [Pseudomonadota bacterium]